jgi:hypothetical protein
MTDDLRIHAADEPAPRHGGDHVLYWMQSAFRSRDNHPRQSKLRVHLDVAPHPKEDHQAEVEHLIGLGATPADIGQGDVRWVVLADPQGNELCVLTPR